MNENDAAKKLPDVLRLIAPHVGSVWAWEPLKPLVSCLVVVTAVTWNGEECVVESDELAIGRVGKGKPAWNDLSRWVEATVFVAETVAGI